MPKVQIGDKVRMSKEGRATWTNAVTNPHRADGEVIRVYSGGDLSVRVMWDNGYSNAYRPSELEIINVIVENE